MKIFICRNIERHLLFEIKTLTSFLAKTNYFLKFENLTKKLALKTLPISRQTPTVGYKFQGFKRIFSGL